VTLLSPPIRAGGAGGVKIGENGQSAGNEIKSSYFARILRD